MASNYPPGVTGNEPGIQGSEWEPFYEWLDDETYEHKLSVDDARIIWRLGLAVWMEARTLKARFPHDADPFDELEKDNGQDDNRMD